MTQKILYFAHFYHQQFKIWTAVQFQYRVAMIIWLIGIIISPVMYMVVWSNVAAANGGSVGGYNASNFAAYFIATMVVNHLAYTWHMWEYDTIIRQGLLSPRLLRPLHPIHADIAENLSYKTITSVVMIPATIALILIFDPIWNPAVWSLVIFVPALILAYFIQFLFGWALAIMAFWTTRIMALNRMYFLGKLFLSGQIAPLPLLPPLIQTIAVFTPYPWMIYFPTQLFLNQLTPGEAMRGLGIQLIWVIAGLILMKLTWRAGVKRYAAFGA
ncbi:MAG: ABC transporter permease [Chloroflexi bacterium]|nr:ABC transporter permease [Chloroflexota bacterium]